METRHSYIAIFLSSAIVAFLTLLLFSGSTSPLYNLAFSDGLVFQYVSAGLKHGQIPYIDIFDHKGPFTYFINYVGQSLGGRYGILFLQWVNMTLTLFLCLRFCIQQQLRISIPFILLITCTFLIQDLAEGDMTEEWSILFLAIPMFALLRSMHQPFIPLSGLRLCFLGICAGVVALLRLNNVAPLAGLFFWCFFLEIRQRHYAYLAKALSFALIGFFIPISIACLWFFVKAGNEGLYELYYANVLFNLEYARTYSWDKEIPLWKELIAVFFQLAVLLFGLLRCPNSAYRKMSIGLICAILLTILTMGRSWFSHYQMILIPTIIISLSLLSHLKKHFYLFIVLLSGLYWSKYPIAEEYNNLKKNAVNQQFQYEVNDLVHHIPFSEQEQTWNLNASACIDAFLYSEVFPQSRFCNTWHRTFSRRFREEETDAFRLNAPLWVFAEEDGLGEIQADSLFLCTNYDRVAQTSMTERRSVTLYHRNY